MTPALYAAARRTLAARVAVNAPRFSRIRALDVAATSGDPCRIARAVACGWTPAGYALLTMKGGR